MPFGSFAQIRLPKDIKDFFSNRQSLYCLLRTVQAKRKASAPAMGRRTTPTTNREVVSPQPRCLMDIPGSKRYSLLASTHVRNGNGTIARKEDVTQCSMMSVQQDVESLCFETQQLYGLC